MSRQFLFAVVAAGAIIAVTCGQASALNRPGDANGDGLVDIADYTAWFNNYGRPGATLAQGDFNGDGKVDIADYVLWFNNYSKSGNESKMCNIKVVTDQSPDYSDMDSMVNSITSRWDTVKDKAWAMFYWNHIARRQTNPMGLHGFECVDPIRQFNDYGYTMCSTISGINSTIFTYMGRPIRYWEIGNHTVMEVMYEDGLYHMHDNSLTALYTICDGSRLAGVEEIGASGACAASNNVTENHHIALKHCLYATSPDGFLEGADTPRTMASEGNSFDPGAINYQAQYLDQDWGHRYVLNLRQHETYLRVSHTLGDTPSYYQMNMSSTTGFDPESKNYRYHIRGNGQWVFTPALDGGAPDDSISLTNLSIMSPSGLQPTSTGTPGEALYKIEGANVITSIKVEGTFKRATSGDVNAIDVSLNNGMTWTNVWTNSTTGTAAKVIDIYDPINGSYKGYHEVLVKIRLTGQLLSSNAQMTALKFTTITMLNSKTQPKLRLGRNTVYVDKGEQSGTIEVWPFLEGYNYRLYSVDESNVTARDVSWLFPNPATAQLSNPKVWATNGGQEAYMTYRIDTPGPMCRITYGGRLYTRGAGAHIDFLHSFDNGATWTQDYTYSNTAAPWDYIHYETITDIPSGCKSVLVKYRWSSNVAGQSECGLYAIRMEANYWPGNTVARPLEVKFTWKERQTNYTTIQRSHIQLVGTLPASYVINVGGADHPIMESMQVNVQGAAGTVSYGYSDGIDVGGTKFQDRWRTLGNLLSKGKPYTYDKASRTNWSAGDPNYTKLTDNVVGSSYAGGGAYAYGPLWQPVDGPINITVDLGSSKSVGALRMQMHGYPLWDSMLGQTKDICEVLTSTDNVNFTSRGFFDFKLRWKDLPANCMWNDEETFKAWTYELILPAAVNARYVRFKLTPVGTGRYTGLSEVQVYDGITYSPFDLKLAPPPGFGAGGSESAGGSTSQPIDLKGRLKPRLKVTPSVDPKAEPTKPVKQSW